MIVKVMIVAFPNQMSLVSMSASALGDMNSSHVGFVAFIKRNKTAFVVIGDFNRLALEIPVTPIQAIT